MSSTREKVYKKRGIASRFGHIEVPAASRIRFFDSARGIGKKKEAPR
jgi:hypothetical protein